VSSYTLQVWQQHREAFAKRIDADVKQQLEKLNQVGQLTARLKDVEKENNDLKNKVAELERQLAAKQEQEQQLEAPGRG
jgi:DNA repair exonuclease SbcCD ATPase subunit